MAHNFGITSWGKLWLQTIEKLDYSQLIPKGKASAQKGDVTSIRLNKNIINAKVTGKNILPYKITLDFPEFTERDKNKILELINQNSFYLSQLEAKKIPPELLEDLLNHDIFLFPQTLDDIIMDCNCPDWNLPCKHISAVIYIITNEIDKNPFFLFNIRNFDILKSIKTEEASKRESHELQKMTGFINNGIPETKISRKQKNYYRKKYYSLDFSKIPNMDRIIGKLLTPNPLFYNKDDFRNIFLQRYLLLKNEVKKFIKNSDIDEHAKIKFSSVKIEFINVSLDFEGKLIGKNAELKFDLENMDELIEYLQNHALNRIEKYPPQIGFLSQIYSFSLSLIQKSACIPEIFEIGEDEYMIRWIPAGFNDEIWEMVKILESNFPADIIFYGKKKIKAIDQIYFLVCFFVIYFQKKSPLPLRQTDYNIISLFFDFEAFTQVKFEDQLTYQTIQLWLDRFYITKKECLPVIKIDESRNGSDEFDFQILIDDKSTKNKNEPGNLFNFLKSENPEKYLVLKDLGLLSIYLPQVNDFLKLPPEKKNLQIPSNEFVGVWFDALPLLQSLGVKTILPKSLKKVFTPTISLKFKSKEKSVNSNISYLGIDKMMDFEWNIAVGDKFFSKDEFYNLVENYSGIVKLKGSYIYIDEKETRKILKQLKEEPELSSIDILKINLNQKYKNAPIEIDKSFSKLFNNFFKPAEIEIPKKLNATLRQYQERGFKWLYNNFKLGFGSLIADDMGLGKTIQVICLLLKLKEEKVLGKQKALVIVPATLLTNWQKEIEKFAPSLSLTIYHGSYRKLDTENKDIVITTYSLIRNEKTKFNRKKWLIVITDESQNIKNPASGQTKAVKTIPSVTKIAMTGTPVENRLMDYWSILDLIMKKLVGSRANFVENFAIPIERFRDESKLEEFRKITSPFILRRVKSDKSIIDDLPEKLEINEYNTLMIEQAALYQQVIDDINLQLSNKNGIERKGLIFKLITSLKQICNHPALYLKNDSYDYSESGKSQLLISLLDKIFDIDEKVLIFSQYKQMGDILVKMLAEKYGKTPLFLHGGLSRNRRDIVINQFQENPEHQVMILSLKAGGTGLNLIEANNVIHYDLWWNPAVESQATDRVFRIGQQKNVTVFRMITKGTFEEKINEMLINKKKLANLTINVGEKWISELTDKELQELVKLDNQ